MRRTVALFLVSTFALPISAQQSQTIEMECRDMAASGNYIGPDETVINGRACRQVAVAVKTTEPIAAPAAQPETVPASAPQPPTDAQAPKGFLLEDATPV